MLDNLNKDGCLYQEDVVDYLVKNDLMNFLKENADGNLVLKLNVNSGFKNQTEDDVVWVKLGRYWRFRVKEDESGREARG